MNRDRNQVRLQSFLLGLTDLEKKLLYAKQIAGFIPQNLCMQ